MGKKKTAKKGGRSGKSPSFEESLAELEVIVDELERGDLGLAAALTRYEDGVQHLKFCQEKLAHAERKIELLSGVDAHGNPVTQPFDEEEAESLMEKSAVRGKRRSRPVKSQDGAPQIEASEMDDAGRLF